jgi:hypothetical protein
MTDLTTPSLLDALLDDIANRVLAKLRINGTSDVPFSETAINDLMDRSCFRDMVDKIVNEGVVSCMEHTVCTDSFHTAVTRIARDNAEDYVKHSFDFESNQRFISYMESVADNRIEFFMENEFDMEDAVKEVIDNLSWDISVS